MQHLFISDFVYWVKAKNHKANKDFLYDQIMKSLPETENKHVGRWKCNVNTEYFSESNNFNKYTDLVTNEIYPALDSMFSEMPLKTPKTSMVKNIWYNYYVEGHNQEIHNHLPNSNISGIYFLHLEEQNKTVFYSYNSSVSGLFEPNKQLIEAEEGDIALFPSNLLHYVLPCEKPRATISFNVECVW